MSAETAAHGNWVHDLECSRTGTRAPIDQPAFLSPAGAPWLVRYLLDAERGRQLRRALVQDNRPWTLWRYRELLPLGDFDARVDLGEGGTPLVALRRVAPAGVQAWWKQEGNNPTGSFKARGLSLAVNRARELGAPGVELASAGNAALALCAYAVSAGLPSRVALPEDTPRTVFERCKALGAEVLSGHGTLVEAAARLQERDLGYWNLSTLREPYRVEGKKTMGLELFEQFGCLQPGGQLPDWIVYPTGGGTGIVGMHKAFDELEALGLLDPGRPRPRFAVVQTAGCAPLVEAWKAGRESAEPWPDPRRTDAWGLRVPKASGDFLVLRALRDTDGVAIAIEEARMRETMQRVARAEGLFVSPEGAACLAALEDLVASGEIRPDHRVVLFQTGDPANYR